ncbi:MAG: hypothetical protein ACHQQ3_01580 [Gemmatimonadales bacterium]
MLLLPPEGPGGMRRRARARMRLWVVVVLLASGAAGPGCVIVAQATPGTGVAPSVSWTRVTYLSGESVYLEAGTRDGLREGSRLAIVRGDTVVADLVVAYISSTRASCTVEHATVPPAVGDSVRFTPDHGSSAGASTVAASSSSGGVASAAPASSQRIGAAGVLRGRFGVRYLAVDPGSGGSLFTQPALDLRLDGQHLDGSAWGLVVDVRAQRSALTASASGLAPPATTDLTRVYQAALLWNRAGSPLHLSLGRQYATAISTLGLFDGAAFDLDYSHWAFGALAGLQPEPMSLGLSGTTQEYGAYAQLHARASASSLWSLTLGAVGAYDSGQIDREFLYLRATYTGRHLTLFAAQELDVNRGWKGAQEGSLTTPTSTFAIANLAVTDWFGLNAGVDNRRNVRLYRDYRSPETVFDDSFREGVWGGASLSFFGRLRLSADARSSSGGVSGSGQSVTTAISLTRLTRLQVGIHARVTQLTGQFNQGQLQSASVEMNPFGLVRVEFTSGRRDSDSPLAGGAPSHLVWNGIDADVGIGRSVYLMISTSRELGALERTVQSYAALSYRF